jgi:hypothetical protein
MDNELLDERYVFKPLPDVNDLPEGDDFVINTSTILKERYVIRIGEYRSLRMAIIKHLLTFYDRIDYCDAGSINTHLSMIAYKNYQSFTFVFYVEEWHCYHQTGIFQEMITQYLAWGISNYHRNNTGSAYYRCRVKHPLTQHSVLRKDLEHEINRI